MPINLLQMGQTKCIKRILGNDKTRQFLEKLGFTAGAEITVICENGGNLIVNVKDSRVALSREMALKIYV